MKKMFIKLVPLLVALGLAGGFTSGASAQAGAAPASATGNAGAGEAKASMCIGCHGIPGYQASFPEVHKVPMISGQSARYLASALSGYQKGDRKHPTMRAIAASLSDQDVLDLAAFYEQQGAGARAPETPPAASARVTALLEKGQCVTCHGSNFSKSVDPSYPKLGGQHADYLFVALKSYQTSGNPHMGRNNATMVAQVQNFSHAELKAIAQYLSSLPGELKVVSQARFR